MMPSRLFALALVPVFAILPARGEEPAKKQAAPASKAGAGPALTTDDDKTIYALGLAVAQNVLTFNLSPAEIEILKAGLTDGLTKAEPKVELETYGPKLQALAEARRTQTASAEAKEAEAMLAKAAAEKGAVKTASGLVFLELKPGTGETPAATDTVKVHYRGTLRDGSEFDSSLKGDPVEFPLNRVIPCWTEALQKMKPGGKAKIHCPAAIAYGDQGAGGKIKPGAALQFEVELISVQKAPPASAPPPTGK